MTELRGRVSAHGEPAAGADVLVLDGDSLAGHTQADSDGRFTLAPAPAPGLRLLARCRRPAAGLAVAAVPAGAEEVELRLEDVAPAWPVTYTVADGLPGDFPPPVLRLVPLALGTLPEDDVRWSLRRVGERAGSAYLSTPMGPDELPLRLQQGRWWFSAELVIASEPRAPGAVDPPPLRAIAAELADGTPLEAMRGGWVLNVEGPATVALRLGPAG
jgi:hypothetical protein